MDKAFKWIGILATVLFVLWLSGKVGLLSFGLVFGLVGLVAGVIAWVIKWVLFLVLVGALVAGLFMILSWVVRELSS